MNDDARPGETFEIEPSSSDGLSFHLPWLLIATAAFAVAELTAHPSIGVIVLCLKFGWNDFLSALWLRRRDPDRLRGSTCSWFYLSSGLWRICLWSFLLLFLTIGFMVFAEIQQGGQVPANQRADREAETATCLIVWLLSSSSATFLTILSITLAWRRKIKVWVTGSLTNSRRTGFWPPQPKHERRNLLRYWLVATGIPLILFCVGIGLVVVLSIAGQAQGNNGPAAVFMGVLLGLGVPLVGAGIVLVVGTRVFARVGASAPVECWPELTEFGYPTIQELRRRLWGLPVSDAFRSDSSNE